MLCKCVPSTTSLFVSAEFQELSHVVFYFRCQLIEWRSSCVSVEWELPPFIIICHYSWHGCRRFEWFTLVVFLHETFVLYPHHLGKRCSWCSLYLIVGMFYCMLHVLTVFLWRWLEIYVFFAHSCDFCCWKWHKIWKPCCNHTRSLTQQL